MALTMTKQGKVVVERCDGDLLVMFPNGRVLIALDREDAERKARSWFGRDLKGRDVGIGAIEWRDGV